MQVFETEFTVTTRDRNQLIDITDRVRSALETSSIKDGNVTLYCPHTTAAITINENADPSVQHDILLTLSRLIPADMSGYRHVEGNSDAHCKSSIVGCTETVPVKNKSLRLGTWQGIYFCEFDGPRSRKVIVQVIGE